VNPQLHDEFVALCALYYSGEISEEEWALLQIHMAYCDSCHQSFLDYQRIAADVMPAMAAAAASEIGHVPREAVGALEAAERQLMNQLDSSPLPGAPRLQRQSTWRSPGALIAACALVLTCVIGVELVRMKTRPDGTATQSPAQMPSLQATSVPPAPHVQQALKRSEQQVASLEQQVSAADGRLKQASLAMAGIEKQLEAEQNAEKQLSGEKDRLSQQLAAAQSELDSMRNRWASAGKDATQQAATTATLETQVRELRAALDEKDVALSEKDRMLALDKDFLAHDRDIRDLIGARNLYIADIFDTNENGKTAKQFGRIFYTRDRSLIFYGFDLDSQAGHRQDVSFQVWGSGSDRPNPVSLGLFYQDDNHKRWVLRCNDAKSLARLDMVFVTVEPPGGSPRPTGKPLLRAYLQIRSNHP
jgi:septal ring factor EnvC (AmiA/AmiB activator)